MNTEKKQWPATEARALAEQIVETLRPVCERIEIAGSLRRGKTTVGDIEILMIPTMETRQVDFFSSEPMNLAAERIDAMLKDGSLEKRPGKTGVFSWGDKNRLAIHCVTGIPVDFFFTTPEKWWVSLVIRTGSKSTNLRLTMGARERNKTLNAYGCGTTSLLDGSVEAAHSEEDVFALCGVPYLKPEQRNQ